MMPDFDAGAPAPGGRPILELRGIRKRFGAVHAVDGVDLDLRAGEIHALVGENGAGKSTLLRILAGVEAADAGELLLDGAPARPRDPIAARRLGIRCVPQELELFGRLSVRENCFTVSGLPRRAGWIDWRAARARAEAALLRLDGRMPPGAPAGDLPAAEKALVQIAAALVSRPRLLALDEPTSSLGDAESRRLFAILRELSGQGTAILYVSHRLGEVLALADRVTVLRDGRRVWTRPAAGLDEPAIIEAMVGRRLEVYFPRPPAPAADAVLTAEGLTDRAGAFAGVGLEVRRGEILGLYGLLGSGKEELARALAGLRPAAGRLTCGGRAGPFRDPAAARAAGLAYVPGDRLSEGNLPGRSVRENITIACLDRLGPALWIDRRAERERAGAIRGQLSIACAGLEAEIETLSGGNQQKALLGRAFSTEPEALVLDEPTRGIDVGARAEIHRWMAGLAAAGKAIVLVSSDLPEVLGMSHRVLVLREGEIAGEFPGGAAEEEAARAALPLADAPGAPAGAAAGSRAAPRAAAARRRLLTDLLSSREAILIAAIILVAALTAARSGAWLSADSLARLAAAAAPLALASAGMTLVIAAGAIDLSVGSMLALAGACWALWAQRGSSLAAARQVERVFEALKSR